MTNLLTLTLTRYDQLRFATLHRGPRTLAGKEKSGHNLISGIVDTDKISTSLYAAEVIIEQVA